MILRRRDAALGVIGLTLALAYGIWYSYSVILVALGAAPTALGAYGYAVLLGVGYSATASLIPAMVSDRFSGALLIATGCGVVAGAAGWRARVLRRRK